MSQADPTEHVLAAIASILDKSGTSDDQDKPAELEAAAEVPVEITEIAPLEDTDRAEDTPVQPDLSHESGSLRESDNLDESIFALDAAPEPENLPAEDAPTVVQHGATEIYSKLGPGPLTAIRFKWAARCDERGDYYVDETIGANSRPITTGPLSKEAAIGLVDEREMSARKRFDALRSEMSGGEIGRVGRHESINSTYTSGD
jgi:hypothetical protein